MIKILSAPEIYVILLEVSLRRLIHACTGAAMFLSASLYANSVFTQTTACAPAQSVCPINDADPSTLAAGVTVSDMIISAPYTILNDGNNNLTLILLGFQHPEAGDLIVQLTNVDAGITRDVFNRMGANDASDPNDPGFLSDFSGNYDFNGSYLDDLFLTAAGLGDADPIPDDTTGALYFPITFTPSNASSGTPSDLSTAFNGLPVAGTWRLTITDMVNGPNDIPQQFTGWTLTFNATPEPAGTGVLGLIGIAAGLCFRHRRR